MPQGKGTLTLRGGKTYSGQFVNGNLIGHEVEILGFESSWLVMARDEKSKKSQQILEVVERNLHETIAYKKITDPDEWVQTLAQFEHDKKL